jgi:hypothetical protein
MFFHYNYQTQRTNHLKNEQSEDLAMPLSFVWGVQISSIRGLKHNF